MGRIGQSVAVALTLTVYRSQSAKRPQPINTHSTGFYTMTKWVCLLRGINVGGKNVMPMASLRSVFESTKCDSVRTYIQSGNVVFESRSKSKANLSQRLLDAIEQEFGFRPKLLLVKTTDFRLAIDRNPFHDATTDPKTLHFFFLDSEPSAPDTKGITDIATPTERYHLDGTIFYLHAPDGFGGSKLAVSVERKLGVSATARNYSTVQKMAQMIGDT